ncbi:MAG TPA: hypothetical protein VM534_06950, partial [Thermoanaerobaculia bacterium]|nr:hypothetical protein [Thermoanaerobaculia bacterium]
LNKVAVALHGLGRFDQALRTLDEERAIYQTLAAEDPEHARWKERLAVNHGWAAAVLEMQGTTATAIEHLEAEQRIWNELTTHDPSNAQWLRNRAMSVASMGNLQRIIGRLDDARRSYDAALTLAGRLLEIDETQIPWRRDRASIQTGQGWLHLSRGDVARAMIAAADATSTLRTILQAEPGEAATSRVLANAEMLAAETSRRAGDEAAARAAYRRVLDLTTRPSDFQSAGLRLRALIRLGLDDDAVAIREQLNAAGVGHPDLATFLDSPKPAGG